MIKQPFYGLFLCGINKRYGDVGTACVGIEGINTVIQIDKNYWKSRTENQRLATLMHEVLHIMLYHVSDYSYWRSFCLDPHTLNIALDLTIESNIPEEWWDDHGVIAEDLFRMFPKLPKYKGTHFYIDFLKKLRQNAGMSSNNSGQNQGSGGGQGNEGNQGSGNGSQGSGNGGDKEAEDCADDYNSLSASNKQKVKDLLNSNIGNHINFGQLSESLSETQKELIKSQIEFQLKETAKNTARGLWPGSMTETLDALLSPKPPVYDWKKEFRRLLGTAFDINRKLTRRKESKRFDDARGSKLKKKHKILIGIDTSGSVSESDFQDFFSEIYHIYKAGSSIHILECDTEITNEYDYNGKMPTKITGRGGTIMKPLYDYWNKSKDYTLFVLFTDGYCDSPENGFLKGNTISIISTGGAAIDKFPGKTIKIDNK